MRGRADVIIRACLSRKIQWNAYSCLLLSFIVRITGETNPLLQKVVLSICNSADLVINSAKLVSLQHLFTNLLIETTYFENPREKRRRMIKYSKFLKPVFSFQIFLSRLGLKRRKGVFSTVPGAAF